MNSKRFDPKHAEELANYPTMSTDEKLFRTEEGEFFLKLTDTWVDMRRLSPDEDAVETYFAAGVENLPSPRVVHTTKITSLTHRQAMEWCIKTQIPETFRGYLLDCL